MTFGTFELISSVMDMSSVFASATRRKYVHVGLTPASMLATVAEANTKPMSSN